jgi:hypothetical protein
MRQPAKIAPVSKPDQTVATPAPANSQPAAATINPSQSPSQPAFAVGSNAAQGTAEAAGAAPISSGWIVTLGIIVLLFVVLLVWRLRARKKGIRVATYPSNLPASPVSNVPMTVPPAQKPIPMETVNRYDASRPPASSSSTSTSSTPHDF